MDSTRLTRRAAGGYLAVVLLLAPMLGLMHGLVHGPRNGPGLSTQGGGNDASQGPRTHAATVDGAAPEHGHKHNWLEDIFSAHSNDSDCRVFDQLCHGDGVPALPLLALPMALSSFVFHFLEGEVIARWAALFEARGPPQAR